MMRQVVPDMVWESAPWDDDDDGDDDGDDDDGDGGDGGDGDDDVMNPIPSTWLAYLPSLPCPALACPGLYIPHAP
jgi:hypothetical protein